jgi:hypothetical protein
MNQHGFGPGYGGSSVCPEPTWSQDNLRPCLLLPGKPTKPPWLLAESVSRVSDLLAFLGIPPGTRGGHPTGGQSGQVCPDQRGWLMGVSHKLFRKHLPKVEITGGGEVSQGLLPAPGVLLPHPSVPSIPQQGPNLQTSTPVHRWGHCC